MNGERLRPDVVNQKRNEVIVNKMTPHNLGSKSCTVFLAQKIDCDRCQHCPNQ